MSGAEGGGSSVADMRGRPLGSLRLSVTDRCNLRCGYCMPEQDYAWLPREELLSFEELGTLVDAFLDLGVRRLRLTGGEPLLRQDVATLVAALAAKERVEDLALTTNGTLLRELAEPLRQAGLQRITVSLDTLRADRFEALTRRRGLERVLDGIDAAREAGLPVKIDTVLLRGRNEDEVLPLLDYARTAGAELRFIEYMDVGGATRWSMEQVVDRDAILQAVGAARGTVRPLAHEDSAPARRYALPDGQVFGIIASTTQPFCADCDRSRVTADGSWLTCLYARTGTDLRAPLRAGAGRAELRALLAAGWAARADRGAEQRLEARVRGPLLDLDDLQADPHLEMHVRGG